MRIGPAIMWTVYALFFALVAVCAAIDEIRQKRENRKPEGDSAK